MKDMEKKYGIEVWSVGLENFPSHFFLQLQCLCQCLYFFILIPFWNFNISQFKMVQTIPRKIIFLQILLEPFGLQFFNNNSTFISLCKWTMVLACSISLPFVIPQCNSSILQFKMLRSVPTDATEFLKFKYTLFYPQFWHNNSSSIFLCKQPINFVLSMYCFFSVFSWMQF